MFVTKDPPDYNQIRRHISAGFTPRMIGRFEDQIRTRTERILDDAARAANSISTGGRVSTPMHVIADIVGIPEADRSEVFRLTDLLMRTTDPFQEILPGRRNGTPRSRCSPDATS